MRTTVPRSALRAMLGAAVLLGPGALSRSASAEEDFSACVASLRQAALKDGVSERTFASIAGSLQPNDVLHFQGEQPEFHTPVWDYMAGLVDDERVADGRVKAREWSSLLQRIEGRFGVEGRILVALWGVESDYGKTFGFRPIVQSLATLSCQGQRPAYFRSEFVAALQILERGDVPAERLTGSWAGAFGHTQFMPSTFLRNEVDFDGDGHADIVDSVPDALGSTANYLRKSGWQRGAGWGYEVKLPAGYAGPSGRKNRYPVSFWAARHLTRTDGRPVSGPEAGLLLPAGPQGPAFLVNRNFDALYAYNAAETYALAIGLLADRIAGGGPLATPWPTDDPGLSRVERRELQSLLHGKGYAIGNLDGVMGVKTLEAIADYRGRAGLPRNGRASASVLRALREGR